MDPNLPIEALQKWARGKPLVGRMWIFGSRARHDFHDDSDLDIAIELDMYAADGSDESGGLATWMFDADGWREELAHLLGLSVDLQQWRGTATPTIDGALQQSSALIYEKPCMPPVPG